MPRLSIEISEQQHQHLKAVAAFNGQTIKDYVLSRAFSDVPHMGEEEALRAMRDFLTERLAQVRGGQTVSASAESIKRRARRIRDETL